MSWQLKIEGQIYVFETQSEFKKVKEMDSKEQKSYIAQMTNEDDLQILDEDSEENEENEVNTDESEENNNSETYINPDVLMLDERISSLEAKRNSLYNSLSKAEDIEEYQKILNETRNLQNEINNLRNQTITYLDSSSTEQSATATGQNNIISTGGGNNIISYAEQFLGEKNPSKKAGDNPFVRVERGGSCDDFATYVTDNSIPDDSKADWYKNLTEKEKAWGPDVFRAAKEAGATVKLNEAKAGDLCAIDLNGNGGMDHTVIIKEVKDGKVYVIESNGGTVQNKTYNESQVCSIARTTK